MYTFRRLLNPAEVGEGGRFRRFTAPCSRIVEAENYDNLIVTVVEDHSDPIGLGLLHKSPQSKSARLISIFIDEGHRNRHLGTRLLALLEEELRKEEISYRTMVTRYPLDSSSSAYFEQMLLKQGWKLEEHLFGGVIPNDTNLPWVNTKLRLPKGYSFFKWEDLTTEDRLFIQEKQERGGWLRLTVLPFYKEAEIEYSTSFGVRYRGEIIGWLILRRVLPNVVEFWSLYIDSAHTKSRIGVILLMKVVKLVQEYPLLTYGTFIFVNRLIEQIPSWLNFFDKRLAPFCTKKFKACEAVKKLV